MKEALNRIVVGAFVCVATWAGGEADMDGGQMIDSASPRSVAPVDWSAISPDMVRDADVHNPALRYSMAYYLGHFHRLANAVRTNDPNRGFIDLHVWRGSGNQQRPHNARVMENMALPGILGDFFFDASFVASFVDSFSWPWSRALTGLAGDFLLTSGAMIYCGTGSRKQVV